MAERRADHRSPDSGTDEAAPTIHLTAVFEPVEEGWVQARIVELPGVITAAPSREEARVLLADALREYLLSLDPGETGPIADAAVRERLTLSLG